MGTKMLMILLLVCLGGYAQAQHNVSQIRTKAKAGDMESQYLLGWCYGNGNGIVKDYSEAVKWLARAAKQNHAAAQYYLGWCYFYGEGVAIDYQQAAEWYGKAAKNGVEEAKSMYKLCTDKCKLVWDKPIPRDRFDPSKPPRLKVLTNAVKFVDSNGNNAIDARETCKIIIPIQNEGQGNAYDCEANLSADGCIGIANQKIYIDMIKAGETKIIEVPVIASQELVDGTADLIVKVNEPHYFGTDPISMTVNTKKFEAPMLKIVDFVVTSDRSSGVLEKKTPFELQVLLQNIKKGEALETIVSFVCPENVILMEKEQGKQSIDTIKGGETKSLIYQLVVNDKYTSKIIPIEVNVSEKYGMYSENKKINLTLNQALASNKIVVEEKKDLQHSYDIKIASISSDVDKNIPSSSISNENTFAVIIANENYSQVAAVPYAINDGRVFKEYCNKTLGLPEENIHFVPDATLNNIRQHLNWLNTVISVHREAKVIFYYAGHGIPDEKQQTAFLLPIDGSGSDTTTGYSLASLYESLGSLSSKSITVFLDACFSGAKREGDMLASARGIAIKVKSSLPSGNMVVFTAAQGDETAYPYKEEGHGMFTYYLLKKIQETKGELTMSELSNYVIEQVSKKSIVKNGKLQTPTLIPSLQVGDSWASWKIK